jgi:hypothetical protein
MSRVAVARGGRLDFEAAAADTASTQSAEDQDDIAIRLKAEVGDGAAERRNALPDLGVVADFVSRSNGTLKVLQSSGTGFAVEIRLPRGSAGMTIAARA